MFYAGSVVGFYFLLSSTSVINRFLPKKVKSVKQATIYWSLILLPIFVYLYYTAYLRIMWRREKKRR